MGFSLYSTLPQETFSGFGATELGVALAIFVLGNALAYALAKALSLDYGRFLAGVIVLFVGLLLYASSGTTYATLFLIGIAEVIIGGLDLIGEKVGTPIQYILDPNAGLT